MMRRIFILLVCTLSLAGWSLAQDTEERELRPRRLYFGAPPATPHTVTTAMSNCLGCHGESATFTPKSPHPTRTHCRQCHVDGGTPVEPFATSNLPGLLPPVRGLGAVNGRPPVMAHSSLLRENCLTCHGPSAGRDIIPTPHPERPGCGLCHMPQEAGSPAP
jgi:cytochrome c-type protein NapB